MTEPEDTLIVYWLESPPQYYERINDYEYHNPWLRMTCVLWRNRWVAANDELLDDLGKWDRLIRAGELGLRWEKAP